MERLPYIDEHSIRIKATPEAVWRGLLSTLRSYRALVIGSRGHRLVVHRLLHRTARRT
jgi:hypothetical protein